MRMHRGVAAAACLALTVAACGSVLGESASQPNAGKSANAAQTKRPEPTEAGNIKLAKAEALRLMKLVPVPPSAVLQKSIPGWLSSPVMGTIGASLVGKTRVWRLSMSYSAALNWVATHAPAGLRPAGTGSGNAPPADGYSYTARASEAWEQAELDVEVAQASDGTAFMRADTEVVWLDPVPVRDTAPGKRLRVLANGSCPASDAGAAGVRNSSHDLARELVPPVSPTAGLECRYHGLNGRPWRLRSEQRLTAAEAARVANSMARLRLSHPTGAAYHCPMDDGSAELIALAYAGRADVDLWVKLNGCGAVSNGYILVGFPGFAAVG